MIINDSAQDTNEAQHQHTITTHLTPQHAQTNCPDQRRNGTGQVSIAKPTPDTSSIAQNIHNDNVYPCARESSDAEVREGGMTLLVAERHQTCQTV